MKIFNVIPMFCLFAFFNPCFALQGDAHLLQTTCQNFSTSCLQTEACCKYDLGSAGLASSNPTLWYDITAPAYPDTVLLSQNRNIGFRQGGVRLKSNGLTILEPGNYSVSFKATLINPVIDSSAVISVILAYNNGGDPFENAFLGSVVGITPDGLGVVQATGILENVPEDTTLSLYATNGGGEGSQLIKVIGWDINAFRIPCK